MPLLLTAVLLTTPPFALIAEGFLLLLGIAGGVGAFLLNAPGDAARFVPAPLTLTPTLLLGFGLGLLDPDHEPEPEADA